MKKTILTTIGTLFMATLSSHAVVLFNEDFDAIGDGDLTADANWTAFSGADASLDVTSGVLTGIGSGAEDVQRLFADTPGVYFGIDVNVGDDANSDYVMGLRDGSANALRVFLSGDGANIAVGVNSGGTGSGSAGATSVTTFALNATARIVGFADGTGTVSAWINPSTGDLGTPDVTFTNADVGDLTGFYFRQGGNWDNGAAAWTADNLIVATTFAEVVSVPEPSTTALLGLAGLATLLRRRR
jgi:hypothetical protein